MNEKEFKTGVMDDGSRLMQPAKATDALEAIHGRGVALVKHFKRMQEMASDYIIPEPYISHTGAYASDHLSESEKRNSLFGADMVYMLDGPEQREAEAELAFDYVAECHQTLSHEWHGDKVAKHVWSRAINDAIHALTQLDRIKKTLFYGRDNNLIADGQRSIEELPVLIKQANCSSGIPIDSMTCTDYIHGVLGLATEAGELLEGLRDAINGKGIDPVNIKEEVGDAKWYMAILSRVAGFMWGDDERTNIEKLRARFPDKFKAYDANNRNLQAERKILES